MFESAIVRRVKSPVLFVSDLAAAHPKRLFDFNDGQQALVFTAVRIANDEMTSRDQDQVERNTVAQIEGAPRFLPRRHLTTPGLGPVEGPPGNLRDLDFHGRG